MTCTGCGTTLDTGARFCSGCGRGLAVQESYVTERLRSERLVRPRERRMIAGVCSGFAQRYGWDVAIVRLVLVLALVFGAGTPLLAYAIAWVVMPNEQLALPSRANAGPGSIAM